MSKKRDLDTAIAAIVTACTKKELQKLELYGYFELKYTQTAKEFESDIKKIKALGIKWDQYLRGIHFWSTPGVKLIYKRLIQLVLLYMPNHQQFFSFNNEIGSFTIPTRTDRLNKNFIISKRITV